MLLNNSVEVYKSVGWKTIATGAAVYGGLYVVERLRWNSAAKEQHLKEQMRSHLSAGMRQIRLDVLIRDLNKERLVGSTRHSARIR